MSRYSLWPNNSYYEANVFSLFCVCDWVHYYLYGCIVFNSFFVFYSYLWLVVNYFVVYADLLQNRSCSHLSRLYWLAWTMETRHSLDLRISRSLYCNRSSMLPLVWRFSQSFLLLLIFIRFCWIILSAILRLLLSQNIWSFILCNLNASTGILSVMQDYHSLNFIYIIYIYIFLNASEMPVLLTSYQTSWFDRDSPVKSAISLKGTFGTHLCPGLQIAILVGAEVSTQFSQTNVWGSRPKALRSRLQGGCILSDPSPWPPPRIT